MMWYSRTALLKLAGVAVAAVALVAFVACGGSSDGSDEAATSGHEDEVSEGSSGAIHIGLNEWSISPAHGSAFEAGAGDAVFEIHNDGAAPHDLKIIKTNLAPDALPVTDSKVVDLEAAGEVVGSVDPLLAGEVVVEEGHLEKGDYVLICNIPGHYQAGMTAPLAVN